MQNHTDTDSPPRSQQQQHPTGDKQKKKKKRIPGKPSTIRYPEHGRVRIRGGRKKKEKERKRFAVQNERPARRKYSFPAAGAAGLARAINCTYTRTRVSQGERGKALSLPLSRCADISAQIDASCVQKEPATELQREKERERATIRERNQYERARRGSVMSPSFDERTLRLFISPGVAGVYVYIYVHAPLLSGRVYVFTFRGEERERLFLSIVDAARSRLYYLRGEVFAFFVRLLILGMVDLFLNNHWRIE